MLTRHSKDEQIPSLHEASDEARRTLDRGDDLFGKLKRKRRGEIAQAGQELFSLASLLLMTLAPIFSFLSMFSLHSPFQMMIVRATIAPLPAKEEALDGARKALEAEDKIMEVEAWAIDRLNEHQREMLRAGNML